MNQTYWLTVTAQEFVQMARDKGFTQVNSGTKTVLEKMSQGDWILYYSPTIFHEKPKTVCQKFTGISSVIDTYVYPQNAQNQELWRRNVEYFHSIPQHAQQFHQQVDFLKQHPDWTQAFCEPIFEISRNDFLYIAQAIVVPVQNRCLLF